MRLVKILCHVEQDVAKFAHWSISRRWKYIFHRHAFAIGIGVGMMLTGSFMAHSPWECMPHCLWDALAYFIHGCGFVPIAAHVEKAWAILSA